MGGCASPPPPTSGSGPPASDDDALVPLDANLAAEALRPVLGVAGPELLAVVLPQEAIEATIDVDHAAAVAALATARGLTARIVNAGTVLVVGPRDDVVVFAAGVAPRHVELADDHRADRWLPDAIPAATPTVAGAPYVVGPMPVDRGGLRMTDEQQGDFLGVLARTIKTIDGRPYGRLSVDGECEPDGLHPVCQLRASGVGTGAAGRADTYLVLSDGSTAGRPQLDSVTLESVPRELIRAAEWIARHDPAALRAIAEFDTCCYASWEPGRPGVLTIGWTKPCDGSVVPAGRPIAETGDCTNLVWIVVDVGQGVVDSIERPPRM
jgi:hypothetical protein